MVKRSLGGVKRPLARKGNILFWLLLWSSGRLDGQAAACLCFEHSASLLTALLQNVITSSFLIGFGHMTYRLEANETNFHLQLESTQNMKRAESYARLKLTYDPKPMVVVP